MSLAILSTHPVQYQVPVYRELAGRFEIPVTAVFGSDFSLHRYHDAEFNTAVAWDVDLLSGYTARFLTRRDGPEAPSGVRAQAHALTGILREVDPRVVLVTGYMPVFDLAACQAAKRLGRPSIFRAETSDNAVDRAWIKSRMRDAALRRLYRRFDKLLYIGQNSLAHYRRLGCAEERLGFSPYCIDADVFSTGEDDRARLRAEARRELGLDEDRVVLLFSGKLSARKAPEDLFHAAERLPAELQRRVDLVFLGAGELREHLEQRTAAGCAFGSHFLGFKNQTELSRYYHLADFLVFPSRRGETWGLVVNEALHHGVPCIVSDRVGCHPDLIEAGVTGRVYEAGNVDQLARAIVESLELKGSERTRDDCRKRVAGYTVGRAAQGIAQAYFELLGPSGGG